MFNSIVILTGAGISAESGIQTFRASDGLWHEHRIEDVATPEAFDRDPDMVHHFYNVRRQQLLSDEVKENSAHLALAELESKFSGKFLLVTQNIDNLHERAGSKNLLHMHGELLKMRCLNCDDVEEIRSDQGRKSICSSCREHDVLRPHIVWFGEMPMYMETISTALSQCDLFISIGTSGNVYPAAGFVQIANQAGAQTLELNLEPSSQGSSFGRASYGKATEIVPRFVVDLFSNS